MNLLPESALTVAALLASPLTVFTPLLTSEDLAPITS